MARSTTPSSNCLHKLNFLPNLETRCEGRKNEDVYDKTDLMSETPAPPLTAQTATFWALLLVPLSHSQLLPNVVPANDGAQLAVRVGHRVTASDGHATACKVTHVRDQAGVC
jgi:hypothetical protein